MSAERCILLFRSIHEVMWVDRELTRAGIWHDMVPVPKDVSSECGMAIEVRPADVGRARRLAEAGDRGPTGEVRTVA